MKKYFGAEHHHRAPRTPTVDYFHGKKTRLNYCLETYVAAAR